MYSMASELDHAVYYWELLTDHTLKLIYFYYYIKGIK